MMEKRDVYDAVAQNIVNTWPLLRLKFTGKTSRPCSSKNHLPPVQFITTLILSENGPMPMSKLARLLNTSKPNMTMLIDRMESSGYVKRQSNERDRRIVEISLTDKALESIKVHREHILKTWQTRLRDLPEADVVRLNELIDEMAQIFKKFP